MNVWRIRVLLAPRDFNKAMVFVLSSMRINSPLIIVTPATRIMRISITAMFMLRSPNQSNI